MKVLLINPPSHNIIRESLPPVVEDDSGNFPPLGLLYVASYAEQIEGVSVQVLDCQVDDLSEEELPQAIEQSKADVVGIQVMTFTLIDVINVIAQVRHQLPDAYIVLGGPHVTLFPSECLALKGVHAVIPGEGEYPFSKLLKTIQEGKKIEEINGVLVPNHEYKYALRYIEDLDELRHPARHLLDQSKYSSALASSIRLTTIMSSRGCPAKCIFCDRPQMGRSFRKRSAASVVDEMMSCYSEFGINEFVFYDDTFTIDKKRVFEICDLIIKEKLKLSWDIRARIDTVSKEMLLKLRAAGCSRIHYGVESGSELIQKQLKKNLDLNKVQKVFKETQQAGIEVLGYFMIGCPNETIHEMEKTFALICSLPMDYAHIGIFTPYPGTEIYNEALASGFYERDYWREFAANPSPDFTPRFWNQHFSDEELYEHLTKAYRSFYSRPSYIFKRLRKVKSLSELKTKSIMGLKLLKSIYTRGK